VVVAPFDALDWDSAAWDKIGIQWPAVPNAERYVVEYRRQGAPAAEEWRRSYEPAPFHLLQGGRSTTTYQEEKVWEVRVAAIVNGQEGKPGPSAYIETGYPYTIIRERWTRTTGGGLYKQGDRFGHSIVGPVGPAWTQSKNPDADKFVGVELSKITFRNMKSRVRLVNWSSQAWLQGSLVSAVENLSGDTSIYAAYRNIDAALGPGGKHPSLSGSGWTKISRLEPRKLPQAYHESRNIRWWPEDVGNLEVKYVSHAVHESISTNPTTGPSAAETSFSHDFVSGRGQASGEAMPNYGLTLAGTWWATGPSGQQPLLGAWIEYTNAVSEGWIHNYMPPKRPRKSA